MPAARHPPPPGVAAALSAQRSARRAAPGSGERSAQRTAQRSVRARIQIAECLNSNLGFAFAFNALCCAVHCRAISGRNDSKH